MTAEEMLARLRWLDEMLKYLQRKPTPRKETLRPDNNRSIYGISAWRLMLDGTTQHSLLITANDEPAITVDNVEVAQFIYLMLNNEKLRDVIDTHKNNRAGVPSASSGQSPSPCAALRSCCRRNPSRVRSCPCIRAPARCGARRRCELPRWDRCRACLPISTGSYRYSRSQSGAARPRTGQRLQAKFRELEDSGTVCGARSARPSRQSK